jgi:hypothetical protein
VTRHRLAVWALLLTAAISLLPLRAAQPPEVSTELRIERSLLSLDLLALKEERGRSEKARAEITQLYARLDQAMSGPSVALRTLEALSFELQSARGAERNSAERMALQLERMQERLRRIALLEGEAGGPLQVTDPITGRWRLRVAPPERDGVLELKLLGAVVSGTYRIDGEGAGFLRGAFANNRLRLEKVDGVGRVSAIFEGEWKNDTLRGTWMTSELASGKASRGEWSAAKIRER